MLLEFTFENFLSYREATTLSLEASANKENLQNVIENAEGTGKRVLKAAVVYGPNASGKSNLIKAMTFMKKFVLSSAEKNVTRMKDIIKPFKLDKTGRINPSIFEVLFIHENIRYLYGFSIWANGDIESEWLYYYPEGHRRKLFERNREKDTSDNIAVSATNDDYFSWGPDWAGEKKRLAKLTRSNSLFLTVAANFNHPIAQKVLYWFLLRFRSVKSIIDSEFDHMFTSKACTESESIKADVINFMQKADLGISDISFEERGFYEHPAFSDVLPIFKDSFQKFAAEQGVDVEKEVEPVPLFTHQIIDESGEITTVVFDTEEESDGTNRYYAIAGPILYTLATGSTLFADELGLHLHPLLLRAILTLFTTEQTNPNGAQVIFTTHNVDLLEDSDLLRRDQIWLVDKGKDGASELYSLWEYRTRNRENLRRGYMAGRYGAIPYVERLLDFPIEPRKGQEKEEKDA